MFPGKRVKPGSEVGYSARCLLVGTEKSFCQVMKAKKGNRSFKQIRTEEKELQGIVEGSFKKVPLVKAETKKREPLGCGLTLSMNGGRLKGRFPVIFDSGNGEEKRPVREKVRLKPEQVRISRGKKLGALTVANKEKRAKSKKCYFVNDDLRCWDESGGAVEKGSDSG